MLGFFVAMRAPMALVLVVVGLMAHAVHYDFTADDTFIFLRYAYNAIEGHGWVFNVGERVEGFSSPLWLLLLVAAGTARADLPLAATVIGLGAAAATVVLTYVLSERVRPASQSRLWSIAAAAVVASNGSFACWAGAGMETPFVALLVTGLAVALVTERPVASAVCVAGYLLARPEAPVVILALAAFLAVHDRTHSRSLSRAAGLLAVTILVVGSATAVRYAYYGELLPNTYHAKIGGGMAQLLRGATYLTAYATDHEGLPLLLLALVAMYFVGEARLRVAIALCAALWGTNVAVGGDGLAMYRFAVAPLPLLAVVVAMFLARLHDAGARVLPVRALHAVTAVGLGAWLTVHLTHPARLGQYGLYAFQRAVEIPRWSEVGRYFREHSAPDDSIAAVPVGALAFHSQRTVRDMLGLTDKHIARRDMPDMGHGWAGHQKHDGPYILSLAPTYILIGNIDVTPQPRDPTVHPFVPYENRSIRAREYDLYESDVLRTNYRRRSIRLSSGGYLNFYERIAP